MVQKNITPIPATGKQLSIFNVQFDTRIRRVDIDGVVYFSILDTFEHYGNAKNPTTSWKTTLAFLVKQGFDQTTEILDWRLDGKKGGRATPFGTMQTFLRIAQVTDFKEWEELRQWMANLANERLEEMTTPGLAMQNARKRELALLLSKGYGNHAATKWLESRIEGIDSFKMFTAAIKAVCDNPQYGLIVNKEYIALFGLASDALREVLNTKDIREKLPPLQYTHLRTAETILSETFKRRDKLTNVEIMAIVEKRVRPLGDMLRDICVDLGIDLVTGRDVLATPAVIVTNRKLLD